MDDLVPLILPFVRPGTVICGHSLGGARALIMAALLALSGKPPDRVVTFGAPRPGFVKLADLLAPIKITAYRNGTGAMRSDGSSHDIVTDLPLHIPGFAPYIHPREPLTDISVPPKSFDSWGPFAWHHMTLYIDGM
jgi:surfactin synthase thioesterase subunit